MERNQKAANRDEVATVLDRLATALGGIRALRASATETLVGAGRRLHPGWGTDPGKSEEAADFSYTLLQDVLRPRYRLSLQAQTHLVPTQLDYTETADGSAGYVDGVDFMFDPRPVSMPVPSWRVAARQRHLDLTSVLRMTRKLLASGSDVTVEVGVGGDSQPVLVLREVGRPTVRVHLDEWDLPVRFSVTEEHPPLGDTLVEVLFGDFRPVDGLLLPYQVKILVNGQTVHEETRSSISVSPQEALEVAFTVPEAAVAEGSLRQAAYAQYSTEWIMTYVYSGVRFYFDLQVAPVTPEPVEVAPGVKIVLGPSHHTLVVEMPDHSLTVEAPLYDEYTHAALAQVKAAFPGKPLRKVIATHFHYDHVGGIREFAAEGGVTVIAGEASVPFFTEVFSRAHSLDPDRFESRPVPVEVRGVAQALTLPMADGGNLTVHRIVSDHSDDMLIVHLSGPRIVFESDLWNPTPAMPRPGEQRGRLATQLYDAIVSLGLDVETIVGGHSGTDGVTYTHVAPLSYLRTAAGR